MPAGAPGAAPRGVAGAAAGPVPEVGAGTAAGFCCEHDAAPTIIRDRAASRSVDLMTKFLIGRGAYSSPANYTGKTYTDRMTFRYLRSRPMNASIAAFAVRAV